MTRKPTAGTVIHGTLNTRDLLAAFADALESYGEDHPDHYDLSREAREQAEKLDWPVVPIETMTHANDVLNDLFDALDAIAGKYDLTFSSTPGDGSDFGFWEPEKN